jgi:hypothetical protein
MRSRSYRCRPPAAALAFRKAGADVAPLRIRLRYPGLIKRMLPWFSAP